MDTHHNMTSDDGAEDTVGHSMPMVFHTGNNEFILLESLRSTTDANMGLACVAVFAVACLLEGMKALKHLLTHKIVASAPEPSTTYEATSSLKSKPVKEISFGRHLCTHVLHTALHGVQVVISYSLMLVFMTYNVWLCLAVISGCTIGYFLFGWKKSVEIDTPS